MHSGKKYSRINCVDVKVGIRGISLFKKIKSSISKNKACFTFSKNVWMFHLFNDYINIVNNKLMFQDNYKRNH